MSTEITVKNAANELEISEQRIRTLCRSGELKARKIGRSWLIAQSSVNHYGLRTAHKLAEDHPAYGTTTTRPIALSFFSGAMGLDLGIEKAGFDIRLASDNDKYCRQTIALNRPNTALLGDINDCDVDTIRELAELDATTDIDLVVGGPPCQAFSSAGRRKGLADERGNAFLRYIDIALQLRPRYIVIENVRGLLSCPMRHRPHDMRGGEFPDLSLDELPGGALNFLLSRLNISGYGISFNLYNSANFGTPQTRERVIIICSRNGTQAPFLEPTHSNVASFGLPAWKTLRGSIGGIKAHHHINFPEKRLHYYRLLGPGENWRNLPPELQKQALGKSYYAGGGKTGFLRRLAWDKPAPTLVTHPAMPATDLAHPTEDRPLSIEEYKRIQEFPDSWALAGPLIQQYRQVGNAVPVNLGLAVGQLIFKLLHKQKVASQPGFKYSRYRNTSYEAWQQVFRNHRRSIDNKQTQQELDLA